MSKKFTTPHDAAKIAKARAKLDSLSASMKAADAELLRLIHENSAAERAEEVRKARVMTPTMLAALKRLAEGEHFKENYFGWAWDENPSDRISKSVVQRLRMAGYTAHIGAWFNEITDAGRAALKVNLR